MNVKLAAILGTTLLAAITTAPAHAALIQNLTPTADTFVSSANPANNYGGAGSLQISAPAPQKGEFQRLLRFDLSAAKTAFDASFGPGNWQLTSLAIKLTAAAPANALFNGNTAGPGGSNVNFAGTLNASWIAD